MQQLRYNEGKAKLSYFYANATAMRRWRELHSEVRSEELEGDGFPGDEISVTAAEELVTFLGAGSGGSFMGLVGALENLIFGLEYDANGRETVEVDATVEELLASAPDALAAFCAVCEYGEAKYLRGNFRKGAPITQYLDSALRHINARLRGDIIDPESGKPHLAHALWNVWTALDQPDSRDDRLPAVYDPADDFGPESELPEPREEMIPPAPDRFDVTEAAARLNQGRRVRCVVNPNWLNTGIELQKIDGTVRINGSGDKQRVSTFPVRYEYARFEEVLPEVA